MVRAQGRRPSYALISVPAHTFSIDSATASTQTLPCGSSRSRCWRCR